MSRVDENREAQKKADIERALRDKAERKNSQEFSRLMSESRQTKNNQAQQAKQSPQAAQARQQALAARSGIQTRSFHSRLTQGRQAEVAQGEFVQTQNTSESRENTRRATNLSGELKDVEQFEARQEQRHVVRRDDTERDREKDSQGQSEGQSGQSESELGGGADAVGQIQRATATAGMKSAGALASLPESALRNIVKEVMVVAKTKAGEGEMHIQLSDNALHGAWINIKAEGGEIHLRFRVLNEQSRRLLSAGETQKQLGDALKQAGLRLGDYQVDGA